MWGKVCVECVFLYTSLYSTVHLVSTSLSPEHVYNGWYKLILRLGLLPSFACPVKTSFYHGDFAVCLCWENILTAFCFIASPPHLPFLPFRLKKNILLWISLVHLWNRCWVFSGSKCGLYLGSGFVFIPITLCRALHCIEWKQSWSHIVNHFMCLFQWNSWFITGKKCPNFFIT